MFSPVTVNRLSQDRLLARSFRKRITSRILWDFSKTEGREARREASSEKVLMQLTWLSSLLLLPVTSKLFSQELNRNVRNLPVCSRRFWLETDSVRLSLWAPPIK